MNHFVNIEDVSLWNNQPAQLRTDPLSSLKKRPPSGQRAQANQRSSELIQLPVAHDCCSYMAMGKKPGILVNLKIAGKWMLIPKQCQTFGTIGFHHFHPDILQNIKTYITASLFNLTETMIFLEIIIPSVGNSYELDMDMSHNVGLLQKMACFPENWNQTWGFSGSVETTPCFISPGNCLLKKQIWDIPFLYWMKVL